MKRLLVFLAAVLPLACTPDPVRIEDGEGVRGHLYAGIRIAPGSDDTKALPVSGISSMYDTFSISEFIYDNVPQSPSRTGEKMVREGSGNIWKSLSSDFSPVSVQEKTLYWAIAPFNADGVTSCIADAAGSFGFRYVTPEDVACQKDLLAACSGPYAGRPAEMALEFRHLLAGVQFRVGAVAPAYDRIMTIKKITVRNILTSGDYVFRRDGERYSGRWENTGAAGDRTLVRDMEYRASTAGTVYGGEMTMMLLPQSCGPDSGIDVELDDGTHIFTSLEGVEFRQGSLHILEFDRLMELRIIGDDVIDVTQEKEFAVEMVYSDGSVASSGSGVMFCSSNEGVASFNGSVLRGVSPGTVDVYACNGESRSNVIRVTVSPYAVRYALEGYPDEAASGGAQALAQPRIFYGETLYAEVYSGNTPLMRLDSPLTDNVCGNDSDVSLGVIGKDSELSPYGLQGVVVTGIRRYVADCIVDDIAPGKRNPKPGFSLQYNEGSSVHRLNAGCLYWYYGNEMLDAGMEYGGRAVAGDIYGVAVTVPLRRGRLVEEMEARYSGVVQ